MDSDIREKLGFVLANQDNLSEDVKKITTLLETRLPAYHDRITSIESDVKLAKRGLGAIGAGFVAVFTWMFKGHV